jgi:hypothetical protein
VALSADGNRALIGGPGDDSGAGATWLYTRSENVWTQQGDKLVGGGALLPARQGTAVALAWSGSTAIIGGPSDLSGAAWVFEETVDLTATIRSLPGSPVRYVIRRSMSVR